jgi:hypothetical protein
MLDLPFVLIAATMFVLGVRVVGFVAPAALRALGVARALSADQ